ncbi:ectoine/hydroxyectoine ABC transporter substrate-binding protein EhuB [Dietzia sp. PP-33]|jgi:polar amino acid transport system substrate-binding protein|uniref:ectoine/hydroxyectoine ABC transporter substrate-binding protein EhuB n=1 Tax=Dietzia sp. PP-33 TaxID=2957500 RepID=UPI0029AC976E|nr:ectoine/hydroxyectoine ABC transporter substrate-binding protein EhuB [Dietzia sp. PP-33]MDX2357003.1 ectoine/hydroxyectoine ABC transporter substrate-binding protein EhuB [Dietzia sp. PP-33]
MSTTISRRQLFRGALALGGVVAVGGSLAACSTTDTGGPEAGGGGGLLERARQQGLRIAIGNEPPYTELAPDGTVTGAEPDVVRAVAARMGIDQVEGIVSGYDAMIPGLKANRWDTIAAGLFMKQSRCSEVAYASPVIVSTESFGVRPGNPENITTIADVLERPDLRVGVVPGGFEQGILETAGVGADQIINVTDARGGADALGADRIDAFLLPTLSLRELDGVEVTEPIEDAPSTGSSAAFRPEDQDFLDAYNTELEAFKTEPEFAEILEKWGFDPTVVEGVTTEELCAVDG